MLLILSVSIVFAADKEEIGLSLDFGPSLSGTTSGNVSYGLYFSPDYKVSDNISIYASVAPKWNFELGMTYVETSIGVKFDLLDAQNYKLRLGTAFAWDFTNLEHELIHLFGVNFLLENKLYINDMFYVNANLNFAWLPGSLNSVIVGVNLTLFRLAPQIGFGLTF